MSRNACARIRDADGASAASDATAISRAIGRTPDENQNDRHQQHDHHNRGDDHGAGKSETSDRRDHQRHADNAAEARAVQRQADRHAALVVEPEAERVGDHAEAGAGPAERQQRIDGIELPRRGDLADQRGRRRHRQHAGQHAVARAERPDRFADERDQQRAEQIEKRRRRRNQRGRPAMNAMQFGDIDALAVKAECPAEGRDQEADRDDPPAIVADRGFVDCGWRSRRIHTVHSHTSAHAGTLHRARCFDATRIVVSIDADRESGFRRAGVVKEPFAEDLVAAPLLHARSRRRGAPCRKGWSARISSGSRPDRLRPPRTSPSNKRWLSAPECRARARPARRGRPAAARRSPACWRPRCNSARWRRHGRRFRRRR